jgi:hypothetical protein
MYLHTLGGSALLHLLIGYPRLILLFGIAGIVTMTGTPHGPGRYAGTGAYLAHLDAAYQPRLAEAGAEQQARQAATDMLERFEDSEILAAIEHTLQQCGPGCTDLATPIVIDDPALLRRVLLLYQLDQAAMRARAAAPRTDADATHTTAQR